MADAGRPGIGRYPRYVHETSTGSPGSTEPADPGDAELTSLEDDLDAVDFELVARLVPKHVTGHTPAVTPEDLTPPEVMPATPDIDRVGRYADAVKQGVGMIRQGMVAALTVAGGQGTRLGLDGPKGAFAISPIRSKTLFQLFAEEIGRAHV